MIPWAGSSGLYAEAAGGSAIVPWDRIAPNPLLVQWAAGLVGDGAMDVGCGLGRDAEFVGSLGFQTHAFDVAPTAIETARSRDVDTAVRFEVADLLARWRRAFDPVIESHNCRRCRRNRTPRRAPRLPRSSLPVGRCSSSPPSAT